MGEGYGDLTDQDNMQTFCKTCLVATVLWGRMLSCWKKPPVIVIKNDNVAGSVTGLAQICYQCNWQRREYSCCHRKLFTDPNPWCRLSVSTLETASKRSYDCFITSTMPSLAQRQKRLSFRSQRRPPMNGLTTLKSQMAVIWS